MGISLKSLLTADGFLPLRRRCIIDLEKPYPGGGVDQLLETHVQKAGDVPGTVTYTGQETSVPVTLTLYRYDADTLSERVLSLEEVTSQLASTAEVQGVRWLNVSGLHDEALLVSLGEVLALHPLTVEDIANVGQRPKVEFFDDYLLTILRMLTLDEAGALQGEQVSFVLSKDTLVTFQEKPGDVFDGVRERLRQKKGRIAKMGVDYLAYALMDALVDTYFLLLETYSDRTETLEDLVVDAPTPQVLARVNTLKRDALFLRRSVWPLREITSSLQREETPLFTPAVLTFVRDLHDHSVQVIDTAETLREILASLHDTYLSSLSFKMNEVMKVLTIVGTIFIPLSFLVGVYGMNFEYMPELHVWWAYPLLWLFMVSLVAGMLVYFRRRGWL